MLKMASPQQIHSSGSDVSPKSPAPSQQASSDYFSSGCASASRQEPRSFDQEGLLRQVNYAKSSDANGSINNNNTISISGNTNTNTAAHPSSIPTGHSNEDKNANESTEETESRRRASTISFAEDLPTRRCSAGDGTSNGYELSKKLSSSPPVSFRARRYSSIPKGNDKQAMAARIRASSPPPERFQRHVGFDNVPNGEATKNNTTSLTLNVRHKGYQAGRRSRTFMVGVDEHSYSDYAIQWLLDELVDDGDEIVAVRVLEKEVRMNQKQYQNDAQKVMQGILAKNSMNRAVSFVLEYAVGKLHSTFQKLIQMYQPAMLIVGTRGRSLGGIQGLVNNRNSFSKYCLQYSPVPVVVVRPTEKRIKKKAKRTNDSTRQTYLGMLSATFGKHEADSEASSTYELETQISADEEAHQVAKVLGLPAAFDPTIKPINPNDMLRARSPAPPSSRRTSEGSTGSALHEDASPNSAMNSEDEDEDDGAFEVMSGTQALDQQQKLEQLHKMEVGEAAALRMGVDDEDEEDESPDRNSAA